MRFRAIWDSWDGYEFSPGCRLDVLVNGRKLSVHYRATEILDSVTDNQTELLASIRNACQKELGSGILSRVANTTHEYVFIPDSSPFQETGIAQARKFSP